MFKKILLWFFIVFLGVSSASADTYLDGVLQNRLADSNLYINGSLIDQDIILDWKLIDSIYPNYAEDYQTTFTRALAAWYTPVGSSTLTAAATGTARFEDDGYLDEPARTNKSTNYNVIGADKDGTELVAGSFTVGRVYRITAQDGEDFTADGAANNNVGTVFTATGTNVTLDANDKAIEQGGTKLNADGTDEGTFVSGLGTGAQNTAAATTAIPGMTVTDTDGNSVLSIVDDTAALLAAGLDNIVTSGKVYKFDNSAGGAAAVVEIAGQTGNTNGHTSTVYGRVTAGTGNMRLNAAGGTAISGSDYTRFSETVTPSAGTRTLRITAAQAGAVVYFTINQLEEGSAVTSPIIIQGATVERPADVRTLPATDGTNMRDSQGMHFETVTFGFDASDIPVNTTMDISGVGATAFLQYHKTAGAQNQFRAFDGTNTVTINIADFNSGDQFKTYTRWVGTTLQVGADGSSGSAGTYDGGWNSDGTLYMDNTNAFTESVNLKDQNITKLDKAQAYGERQTN